MERPMVKAADTHNPCCGKLVSLCVCVFVCFFGPLWVTSPEDEKCVYELSAVLIHRGVSAYSGHYIAHVRDARTSDWYKFNDEEIEKMEGKKLQLGIEEDIGEPP